MTHRCVRSIGCDNLQEPGNRQGDPLEGTTTMTTTTTQKAISSTSIAFGLVNVPGKLYKATESHDISFHQHHGGCGGAVGQKRVCKACEQEVPYADIVKGIEHDGQLVIVAADELKALQDEQPAIEVTQFINESEIDPVSYESAYYFAPLPAAVEGYALLRQVLVDSGRAALVKFALRDKLHLGVLRVSGKVLVIHTISWPDEVRQPAFPVLDVDIALKPKMLEMATALVDAMTAPFVASEWVDTYTDRVGELIAAKAAGGEITAAPAKDESDVDDLLAALEASIAKKGKKSKKAA